MRDYGVAADEDALFNVINVMTNAFPLAKAQEKFNACVFFEKKTNKKAYMFDDYVVAAKFEEMLNNPDFETVLREVVDFGLSRYERDYSDRYKDTDLVLYKKYTYEDVCRLLKWEKNGNPQNIGGYQYNEHSHTFPVFINYDKGEEVAASILYEDRFESPQSLIAISKNGRRTDSNDVQTFLNADSLGIKVELFVRKNKDDKISKEFYYLGRMHATGNVIEFTMPNTNKRAVEIEWKLETPVREDIYNYIKEA